MASMNSPFLFLLGFTLFIKKNQSHFLFFSFKLNFALSSLSRKISLRGFDIKKMQAPAKQK